LAGRPDGPPEFTGDELAASPLLLLSLLHVELGFLVLRL
jgi:hypothetical protein